MVQMDNKQTEQINLSAVGGLNLEVLARMGDGLVVLTSDRVPGAVVMPYTGELATALEATKKYTSLLNGDNSWPKVKRLKQTVRGLLSADKALVVVRRRATPIAVLLPYPRSGTDAARSLKAYLAALDLDSQ